MTRVEKNRARVFARLQCPEVRAMKQKYDREYSKRPDVRLAKKIRKHGVKFGIDEARSMMGVA